MMAATGNQAAMNFPIYILLPHSLTARSRKALAITETELKLIAALAIIGLSNKPKTG